MPLDPATFLPALLTVVGGGFLSILLARLLTLILGRVVRRTRTGADDFIVQVLGETIPPAGWVVSAALAWQIIPTSAAGDQVVFGVAKLVLVVLLVRLVNRIGIRLLRSWAGRQSEEAVATMIR
jgi:hypothetical protein